MPEKKTVRRYVLEGGVGAGKTTLLKELAFRKPEWECFEEPLARWQSFGGVDYLERFYEDPARNCFDLQNVVIESYKEIMELEPKSDVQFYERSGLAAVEIFSPANVRNGYLTQGQLHQLKQKYVRDILPLGEIDGWIYLRTTPELCYKRMKERGYPSSGPLTLEYARIVHDLHEEVFVQRSNTIVVDETKSTKTIDCKVNSILRFVSSKHLRSGITFVC